MQKGKLLWYDIIRLHSYASISVLMYNISKVTAITVAYWNSQTFDYLFKMPFAIAKISSDIVFHGMQCF